MNNDKIKIEILDLEEKMNFKFPILYSQFLNKIPYGEVFEVYDTGICLYSVSDLIERNNTYEIQDYEPNFFMIGQDGDEAYFINSSNYNDETIYSNDLGAIGSLSMQVEAEDINIFIDKFKVLSE